MGHIIIVTDTRKKIDEGVTIIREEVEPKLYKEIVELVSPPITPPTFFWPTQYIGQVTQAFGINPQWYEQYSLPGHEGIDMKAPMNSAVYAAWGGEVIRNEMHGAYGWSLRTEAEIDGEVYEFVYAHFAKQSPLEIGSNVTIGQLIGLADSTGNSTGSHLHFSLKKRGATESGETEWPYDLIDPTPFFKELRD